jgi:large subunit ribosomal protein L22
MQVVAIAKSIPMSAEKLGLVVEAVRGKQVDQALAILRFSQTTAARQVARVVESAMANAENNYQLIPSEMRIVSIFANQGRSMRRFKARARGRVSPIIKRSSHVTVILGTEES